MEIKTDRCSSFASSASGVLGEWVGVGCYREDGVVALATKRSAYKADGLSLRLAGR